jgi:hypothetical protein
MKLLEDDSEYFAYIGNSLQPQRFDYKSLLKQTFIRSFFKTSRLKLLNRWSTETLREIPTTIQYNGTYLIPNHPIHHRGLKGQNEIIGLIDSGIDTNHCFFKDDNNPVPINEANLSHRKIVSYVALADSSDNSEGHGTHVAGTLAGNANCLNSSAGMYNDQAPKAKILFYDIFTNNSFNADLDFEEIISQFERFGVSISSNSYGTDEYDLEFSNYFD